MTADSCPDDDTTPGRRRTAKLRAGAAVATAVLLGAAPSPGFATSTVRAGIVQAGTSGASVRIEPDPVSMLPAPSHRSATVHWTGRTPSVLVFVSICKKSIEDPTFEVSVDCAALSTINPNGTPDGSGSVELTVFRGQNPDGETPWGCFAGNDQVPPGVERFTTCYVRVTERTVLTTDDDVEIPLRYADGPEGAPGIAGPGLVRPTPILAGETGESVGAEQPSSSPAGTPGSDEERDALQVAGNGNSEGISVVG